MLQYGDEHTSLIANNHTATKVSSFRHCSGSANAFVTAETALAYSKSTRERKSVVGERLAKLIAPTDRIAVYTHESTPASDRIFGRKANVEFPYKTRELMSSC